jgi:hypothetical protein
MQYSPDAFDSFIKQKLDEVEVDPSMADDYWSKMNNDLATKKGMSVGKKFFYLSLCLVFISSIFYFTFSEPSDAFIKEKAVKHTPAIKDNKELLSETPSDEQSQNNSPKVKLTQNNTAKFDLHQRDERKAISKSTDNTRIIHESPASESVITSNAEIAVSNHNKTSTQAPPVIAKDSIRAIETNPVLPKKKKTPVTIIW